MSEDLVLPPDVIAAANAKAEQLGLTKEENDFVTELHTYRDHRGITIEHNVRISGKLPKGFPEFVAKGMLEITKDHRQPVMGVVEGAEGVWDAFEKAPAVLDQATKDWVKRMEENAKARIASESLRKKLSLQK